MLPCLVHVPCNTPRATALSSHLLACPLPSPSPPLATHAGITSCALVKHPNDIISACNQVRKEYGVAPAAKRELEELAGLRTAGRSGKAAAMAEEEAAAAAAPFERPPPISDLLLEEIRRRVSLRLKRSEKYLAAPKFYRAAADLCSPPLRDEHWGKRSAHAHDMPKQCGAHAQQHARKRGAGTQAHRLTPPPPLHHTQASCARSI